MKTVLMQFLSLDGVCQGPGSAEEDPRDGFDRGGWLVPHIDEEFLSTVAGWLDGADGLLLGRHTYTAFARSWPAAGADAPMAATMNRLPKYVVGGPGTDTGWGPVTLLADDPLAAVAALRSGPGRELQIHGSGRLAASLLAAGLVDELRLAVAPVIVGAGRRLLAGGPTHGLAPIRQRTTATGVVLAEHAVTGSAQVGTYEVAR